MIAASEFIAVPKVDAHNHLNLGMRYASYAPWAGFLIPDFPRKINGLDDMHTNIIEQYTRPRCKTAKDVQDLLILSIQDAVSDGVKILEGSVDIGFVIHCGGVAQFIELVRRVVKKFAGQIDFRPELGMGKTFGIDRIRKWAPDLIDSGVFRSIDLYGPEVEDGIADFKEIYNLAAQKGLKKKAHVGEFSDAHSVRRFIELLDLDEVQHGIGAAQDADTLKFLAQNDIRCNICPASNEILGAVPSLAEHPIRRMVDAGVKISIATDDLLLFNKSNSEQCADLVNAGLFTEQEMHSLLDKIFASYD